MYRSCLSLDWSEYRDDAFAVNFKTVHNGASKGWTASRTRWKQSEGSNFSNRTKILQRGEDKIRQMSPRMPRLWKPWYNSKIFDLETFVAGLCRCCGFCNRSTSISVHCICYYHNRLYIHRLHRYRRNNIGVWNCCIMRSTADCNSYDVNARNMPGISLLHLLSSLHCDEKYVRDMCELYNEKHCEMVTRKYLCMGEGESSRITFSKLFSLSERCVTWCFDEK